MQEGFTAKEIAEFLGADIRGDKDAQIYGLNTLNNARGRAFFFLNPHTSDTWMERKHHVILSVEDSDYAGSCL